VRRGSPSSFWTLIVTTRSIPIGHLLYSVLGQSNNNH
jgi:hypothetical protein